MTAAILKIAFGSIVAVIGGWSIVHLLASHPDVGAAIAIGAIAFFVYARSA